MRAPPILGKSELSLPAAKVASIAVVALMVITVGDVIGRHLSLYVFSGVVELSTLLCVIVGMFGLPRVIAEEKLIAVDLMSRIWGKRSTLYIDSLWSLCAAGGLFFCAFYMVKDCLEKTASGEVSAGMSWPIAVFIAPGAFGLAYGGVMSFIVSFRKLRQATGRDRR